MKKILSLILCALMLVSSCTKETSEPEATLTETVADTNVLTNIFRGTEVEFRADFEPYIQIDPCYDAETGTVTVFGQDNDGSYFVSFDTDGQIVSEQPLVKGHDTISQQTGVITSAALYILCFSYDEATMVQEHYLMRYSRADGSRTYSEPLSTLFTETTGFYSMKMAVDPDGYVYLENNSEIVVLDADLKYCFTVMSDAWVKEMTALSDGVYIRNYLGIQKIDREMQMLTGSSGFPDGNDIIQYCSGAGYDLCYTDNAGLYGYNFAADGQQEGEAILLCDWQNSNLYANNVNITNIINPDCVVMQNDDGTSLVIYHHSEDIDLSEITTLEIAYVYADSTMSQHIVRFNKENLDIRIITKDYSVYNTDVDYYAGEKKLINDMLNGLCTPDIIAGDNAFLDMFTQIIENNLYTDLYTLMENDPDIKKDDLLGSIRRMCESEDGELMMLPGQFTVMQTLIAPASMVGDRSSWTLTEMLDFIESLPEDVLLLENMTQGNASFALFGNTGYGMFIDTEAGTCNFESEEFLRYLRVLKTLPEGGNTGTLIGSSPELRDAYLTGGVALKTHSFYNKGAWGWMSMYAAFGTEETVPIGYASTEDTVSNALTGFAPYVIPTTCEHPEEAWQFLESCILSYDPDTVNTNCYPVLKSQFEQYMEADLGSYYEIYLDGTVRQFPKNVGYNPNKAMQKAGFRMLFDETEAAKMLDWFDNRIGLPLTKSVKTEVADIINEEISAYLCGIRTAEDCAGIIQSRVSIWLAEHE